MRIRGHSLELTFGDVRASIAANWTPTPLLSGESGRVAMADLWKELVAVQAIGAWRSTVALAGQILEATVKGALTRKPGSMTVRAILGMRFIDAITRAVDEGLFHVPAGITVVGGLHSARVRRNFASHFDPYARVGPNETWATYLLASLVCFCDALAFQDDLVQLELGRPDEVARARELIRRCAGGEPLPPGDTWSSLFDTAIAWAGPRSCARLCGIVLKSPHAPTEDLVLALHRQFHVVLRRSARSHVNDIVELIGRLRALRMKPHALVLASLLPLDDDTLASVIGTERSLETASRFLEYSRLADRDFYERELGHPDTAKVIAKMLDGRLEVKERLKDGQTVPEVRDAFGSQSLSRMLGQLPPKTQYHIWEGGFADRLVPALRRKPPIAYGHFLGHLRPGGIKSSPVFRRAQRQLCEALVDRCRTEDLRWVRSVLVQLPQFTDPEGPLAYALTEVVCRRLAHEDVDEETGAGLRAEVETLFPQLAEAGRGGLTEV
jgi:hypothetical protein